MNVVWLTVNSSYSHSSLALPLIHGACRGIESEWFPVGVTIKDDVASVAISIEVLGPDIVCAPLYIFNRPVALSILSRVHELCPGVIIAVGGPECLGRGASELLDQYAWINFACRGEGEITMPGLLQALLGRGAFSEVAGLVYRDVSGAVQDNGSVAVYGNWSEAAAPCLDELYDFSKPFVQIETSRGCPNTCIFCTSARSQVRYKSLESVRQELEMLRGRGVRELRLLDRTFNVPSSRALELLRMFRKEFADMHFHLEIHPALLTGELREELAVANPGQLHLEAGIQTLQPEVLEAIGRGGTRERALDGLGFLCSLPNLAVHTDLIAGCPRQTLPGLLEDMRILLGLRPAEIQLEVMKILPGTPLARDARELGVIHAREVPYDVMRTPTMSSADIACARQFSRMLDIFHNAAPLQTTFRMLVLENADFLEAFRERLLQSGMLNGPAPHLKQRFLALNEYAVKHPHIQDKLAATWLNEAYTPGDGPAVNARFIPELPENAAFLAGKQEAAGMRDSKFVRLACSDGTEVFFVYNRALAPNKAVASLLKKH